MPTRQGLGRSNITSPFGWRNWSGGGWHNGVDVAAITNERVNAMARGTVTFSGWDSGGGGEIISIVHPNGVRSLYMHLNRRDVSTNSLIASAGQQIGGAGTTGMSSGVHLHFEIRNSSNTRMNPLEIWHWDDDRHPGINPNPLFWFMNGSFAINHNFNPSHATLGLNQSQESRVQSGLQRREVYYQIDGFIINLVSHDKWVAFRDAVLTVEGGIETMPLVKFIQHFDITREMIESTFMKMDKAREKGIAYLTQNQAMRGLSEKCALAHKMMSEVRELPNLEIIFTFDNVAINLYYAHR